MARNEEKQLGRLNRLLLKQDKEEQEKKNPKRPRLEDLNSSDAIKKWIPSIKRDIDFCLKQSQVPCYPESKIQECNKKIDYLRHQYWAFVRKLRQLDPSTGSIPWTDRHYAPKKRQHSASHPHHTGDEIQNKQQCIDCSIPKANSVTDSISNGLITSTDRIDSTDQTVLHTAEHKSNFCPISTPILDSDSSYQTMYGYEPVCVITNATFDTDLNDQPLKFGSTEAPEGGDSVNSGSVPDLSRSDHCDSNDQARRHLVYRSSSAFCEGNVSGEKTLSACGLIPYSDTSDDDD
ncbi:uncharacterized protein LOC132557695 [Ylistrum balloti]|uniref:uncharacterized protein LOC132557695 n=1 Tax=Ylistrum balloti TaxID=509963 RepID=UPI002905B5F5|nr:uncharacterized protein LOC132557695 [Ylistrum balloti]